MVFRLAWCQKNCLRMLIQSWFACARNQRYCFYRCILFDAYKLDNKIIRPWADNYKTQKRQKTREYNQNFYFWCRLFDTDGAYVSSHANFMIIFIKKFYFTRLRRWIKKDHIYVKNSHCHHVCISSHKRVASLKRKIFSN